jgi:hypothetical protein
MNNDEEELKFFDSWHIKEEVPFEIDDKDQNRSEELNILFESHFSLDNFESSRVYINKTEKSIK